MHKILVTGATGFIGQYLVNTLHARQYPVRALVRSRQKGGLLPHNTDIFVGDLTDENSLAGCCRGIDTVFHLGGQAHADDRPDLAIKHQLINYEGTKHLFHEALKENVKKFIYFSTVKAVADSPQLIDEHWDEVPLTPYGIAKREAEKWLLETQASMHLSILRPALVYGPRWKGNLAAMLSAIDKGRFLPVPETHNRKSMVSIEDVCQAALLAAENSKANKKIYFVTDGLCYSTRQLYVALCQALDKPLPRWHVPLSVFKLLAQIGDGMQNRMGMRVPFNSDKLNKLFASAEYNASLIQRDLGFSPRCNLFAMLPEIIAAYRGSLTAS